MHCGGCCRVAGTVRLSGQEVDAIANALGLPVEKVTARYLELMPDRRGLTVAQQLDGACVFLEENRCRIQAVKPRQCREFPHNWRYDNTEEICKGLRDARK